MSACLLSLQKEVGGLREELHSVELKEMKEINRRLKYEVEQERCGSLESNNSREGGEGHDEG